MGKVTVIIETTEKTTRELEEHIRLLTRPVANLYNVYIVPSDDEPYDGPPLAKYE